MKRLLTFNVTELNRLAIECQSCSTVTVLDLANSKSSPPHICPGCQAEIDKNIRDTIDKLKDAYAFMATISSDPKKAKLFFNIVKDAQNLI